MGIFTIDIIAFTQNILNTGHCNWKIEKLFMGNLSNLTLMSKGFILVNLLDIIASYLTKRPNKKM